MTRSFGSAHVVAANADEVDQVRNRPDMHISIDGPSRSGRNRCHSSLIDLPVA